MIGPYDEIQIPRGSEKTDWEVERRVVIGHEARYLNHPDEAAVHIAGYVLSHDVSERSFQLERGGQWTNGKSCDTFNPLGPFLLTSEAPCPSSSFNESEKQGQSGLGLEAQRDSVLRFVGGKPMPLRDVRNRLEQSESTSLDVDTAFGYLQYLLWNTLTV